MYIHAERKYTFKEGAGKMLRTRFGIEIEFTGITRKKAAQVAAKFLEGTYQEGGTYYDRKKVIAPDRRVWQFMSDGSILCQKRRRVGLGFQQVGIIALTVSPILTYREDIEPRELVKLRRAGAFANIFRIHIP